MKGIRAPKKKGTRAWQTEIAPSKENKYEYKPIIVQREKTYWQVKRYQCSGSAQSAQIKDQMVSRKDVEEAVWGIHAYQSRNIVVSSFVLKKSTDAVQEASR